MHRRAEFWRQIVPIKISHHVTTRAGTPSFYHHLNLNQPCISIIFRYHNEQIVLSVVP